MGDRPIDRAAVVLWVIIPVAVAMAGVAGLGIGAIPALSALGAAGAIVLSEFVRVPTRSEVHLTPALAVVAALPIIHPIGPTSFVRDLCGLMSAVAVGSGVAWVLRIARGAERHEAMVVVVRRLTSALVYLTVFAWTGRVLTLLGGYVDLLAIAAGIGAAFVSEIAVGILLRSGPPLDSRLHLARRESADVTAYAMVMVAGAWGGYVWLETGVWALLIGSLVYFFVDRAFRRLHDARTTYDETIRSLARIPEVANQVVDGHADRTADLAVAVARRYRVGPEEVDLIQRSALLHDIGRISMNDPGVAGLGATDAEIAGWGAEIVREASLGPEADIIARQCDVFRHPGLPAETDLPLGSRVVKVCSAYDQGVHDMGLSPLESMERLHRGSVYDFDPGVVDRLREVLEARGAFSTRTSTS